MKIHWNIENPWLSMTITFAVLPPACDGWFAMFSTVLRLPSISNRSSQHTEAHDEQRFVLLRPCPDRTGLALVFNILVLCRQHRLGLHALRHQGSSSPFGGMDGSASHTLTGNDSVFTGHLGAWNRSAHNLPIRGERTLPPNTMKSLGCRV